MGLIAAGLGAASGVLRDQYKEYFYCDALDADILAARGKKRGKRGFNNGSDNIITSGSVVAVNDGQCMIIVDQGKIVDLCSEPGEYRYDASTSPSVFAGGLAKGVADSFEEWKRRVSFGGDTGKDQRVYYINTKEIVGNKYGTPNPVPFRVVDANIGLDVDIAIACHGEYSYRIEDPILFYRNVCGNVDDVYARSEIDSQLKTELLTALQPAFAKISEMGIRYSAVPAHTAELALALNQVLSDKWEKTYGIRIASFGISSMKASEEDEKMIKDLQRAAVLRNPTMAAATLTSAQAQAMQDAARNTAAGPMMAFAGMNAAQSAGGVNAGQLYSMGAQQQSAAQQQSTVPQGSWTCPSCGQEGNTGKFCAGCGSPRPQPKMTGPWTCPSCGQQGNTGNFCTGCGAKRP